MTRFALVFALCAAATFARAERPADFAYGIPVHEARPAAFQRVAVPAGVYEGSVQPGLADLRVFNANGELVPFAFVPPRPAPRERAAPVALPMFPLYVDRDRRDVTGLALVVTRNAEGTAVGIHAGEDAPGPERRLGGYVLDASALDAPLVALTFSLPTTAGAATMRLAVDASDDLAAWRSVARDATLVDLEYAGQRLSRDRIEFAPAKAKYFRLAWSARQPAIAFTAVAGERGERAVEAPREWRTVAGAKLDDREGEFAYDLGGAFPVDRIAVELVQPNSVVPATLLARSAAEEPWRPAGATVFYRIAEPGGDATSSPYAVEGGGRRYWLLRFDPRSGAATLPPPSLRAGWVPQEIVFAARGPAPFTIAYGKHAASAGALPVETLVPGYDRAAGLPASVAVAGTGPVRSLGGPARLAKPSDLNRYVLWTVLVFGALLLGFMAWRLSRELAASDAARKRDSTDVRDD